MTSEVVICPECEGVIGSEPGPGQWACRCFANANLAPKPAQHANNESTHPGAVHTEAAAPVEKICRVCKKNLSGHRRLKDDRGYICLACDEAEKNQPADGLEPCAECGRRLRPVGLVEFNGMRICKKCLHDHKELNKFKPMPANLAKNYTSYEKSTIRNLLIFAGVLLLIFLLASIGIIGSRK
jgi:hypothetical protein